MKTTLESKLYAADVWGFEQQLTGAGEPCWNGYRPFLKKPPR